MVDLKRVITGFLVVAFIASSVVLLLSNSQSSKLSSTEMEVSGGGASAGQNQAQNGWQALRQSSGQAYVEAVPEAGTSSLGQANTDQNTLPPIEDPSNLTDNLAQKMTQEMIQIDPQNPGTLDDIVSKATDDMAGYAASIVDQRRIASDISGIKSKLEEETNKISLLKNYGPEDVASYVKNLNSIFEENYTRSGISEILNGDPLPSSISSVQLVTEQTLLRIGELKVPEALANFHKSLVRLTLYQKNILDLVQDENDPLRAGLVFQLQERDYNAAIQNFAIELKKANSIEKLSGGNKIGGLAALLRNLFLPKTAHAVFGFGDITFDPPNLTRMILEWGGKIFTEKLKKRLVTMIVNRTTSWIQGKGNPRFATDLLGTARETVDSAIGAEIFKALPQVCSPIQPFITLAFKRPPNPRLADSSGVARCTLTEAVENVKEFYNSFSNGGWEDYFQIISPQNNPFGVMITLSDLALTKAQATEQAAGQKVANAGGFLSTKVCKRPTSPPLVLEDAYTPEDIAASPDLVADAKAYAKQAGMDYVGPIKIEDRVGPTGPERIHTFKTCEQGGWEDTTPGKVVGESLSKAIGLHDDWIVNANDMVAIATAFIDSLINRVFQAATKSGGEEPGFTQGVTNTPQPADYRETCKAYAADPTSTEYLDCIKDAKDLEDMFSRTALSSSTLLVSISAYRWLENKVIDETDSYATNAPATMDLIGLVINKCDAYTAADPARIYNAQMALAGIQTYIIEAIQKSRAASSSLQQLADLEVSVRNATNTIELAQLTRELNDSFDVTSLGQTVDDYKHHNEDLRNVYNDYWIIWKSRTYPVPWVPGGPFHNLCSSVAIP